MERQEKQPRGSLEEEKRGESFDPRRPQPEAGEVESAHLLANDARDRLRRAGLPDRRIQELADEYVARDLGGDTGEFVSWAKRRAGGARS